MRAVRQTLSAGGAEVGAPIPIDQYLNPTNIGLAVVIDATATYTVEHTFDDVFASTFVESTAVAFSHDTMVGQTDDLDGNYVNPIVATRMDLTAHTTGTATCNVIQTSR